MAQRQGRRTRILALAIILLLALAFRLWGLAWGLHNADVSRRPHPDEWVLYWLFQWFDTTHSLNPCPNASRQCFFDWGSIYIYLAYFVHALVSPFLALLPAGTFGPQADPVFVRDVLAGRITSALVSTLTVLVAYRFASVAYGAGAGLIAAAILGLSGLLIQLAHFATPDATTGFLMTASLYAMYLAMRQPTTGRFARAGLLVGLSVGSEYHMALLAVPLVCSWLLSDARRAANGGNGSLLAALGCAAVSYLATNPYALIELNAFVAATEHTIRIRTVDSQAQEQGGWQAYDPAWLYVIRYPLGFGEGFALSIWLMAGVLWAGLRRRKTELLLLSWIVPYFLLVSWSSAKFMRYSAPLLPPLAILAAAMAMEILRESRRLVRSAAAVAAALALSLTGIYDAAYAGLFTTSDPRSAATSWIAHHASPGTRIGFEQLPNGLINLPYFVSAAGYRPCFSQFQSSRLQSPASYFVLDNYSLEVHPAATQQMVANFRVALASDSDYRLVEQIHYVPTILGLRFPIDRSPHDWRYPAREISIYQDVQTPAGTPLDAACYPNLPSALAALYPKR